jgi:CHAD domain-containing protein
MLNRMAAQARRTLVSPDPEEIHDLRVSIRRLMASLDLFDSGLGEHGGRKIRKRVKKLLNLAGAVRDCDVAAKYVEKVATEPSASAQLLAAIQAQRYAAIPDLLAGLQERLDPQSLTKWRGKLRTAPGNGKVEKAAREILDGMFQEFMKRGLRAANPHASGRQLHHFRLAAKSLHYALELPVAPEKPAWLAGAKAVQKLVGEIHDCQAVGALIKDLPGSASVGKTLLHRQRKKRSQFRDLWHQHLSPVPTDPASSPIPQQPASAAKAPVATDKSRPRSSPPLASPSRPAANSRTLAR